MVMKYNNYVYQLPDEYAFVNEKSYMLQIIQSV